LDALLKLANDLDLGKVVSEQDLPTRVSKWWTRFFSEHVPRKKYQTDSEWSGAIIACVDYSYNTFVRIRSEIPKVGEVFYDPAFIEKALAFEERIDAKIDKDIVSLGRMKTMQAMGLGRRRNGQANEPLNQVDSPPMQAEGSTVQVDEDE
jgi:hypothetical protein